MAVKSTVKKTTKKQTPTPAKPVKKTQAVAKKAAAVIKPVAPKKVVAKKMPAKAPVVVKLSAEMLEFRQQLLEEKARLESELDEIESRTTRMDETERASEMSHYEDLPADLASVTFEREKDLAIGESVNHLLLKVVAAIEKIDRGTYGMCDGCGKPIKKARLKALPFATLCLECQDRYES
jgi:RNA polymerase-binding protein DksA